MNKKLTPELANSIAADPIIIFYLKTIGSNSGTYVHPAYSDTTLRSSICFVGGQESAILKNFGKLIKLYRRLLLYYYSDKCNEDIGLIMECFTPAEIQECFNTIDETIAFWHWALGSLFKPLLLKELFLEIMIEWAKRCYYRNGQLFSTATKLYMDQLRALLRLNTRNYAYCRMELNKLFSLMDFSTYTHTYEGFTSTFFNVETIILDIKDRLNPLVRKFVLADYGIYSIETDRKQKSSSNAISPVLLSTKSTKNRKPHTKLVVIKKFYKADESTATTTTTSANKCATKPFSRRARYDAYKYSPTGLDEKRRTVKTYQRKNKVKNHQYGNYSEVKDTIIKIEDTEIMSEITITDDLLDLCTLTESTHDETKSPVLFDKNAAIFSAMEEDDVEMDPATLKEIENEREAASSIQFNDVDGLEGDDRELDLFTISESTNNKQMISPAQFDEIDALFGSANEDNIEMFALIETDSEIEESDAVENVQVRNDVRTATLKDIVAQPSQRIDPEKEHEVVVKNEPLDYQPPQQDCTDFPYPDADKIISVNNISENCKVEPDDKDIYIKDEEKVAELRNIPATLENVSTTPYESPVFTLTQLSSTISNGAVDFLIKIENPEFEPQIKTEQEVDNENIKTEPQSSLCETNLQEEINITNAQDAIEYLKKLKRFVHRNEDCSAVMLIELLEQCLKE